MEIVMVSSLQIIPITGIPLLKPGDDLVRLIVESAAEQGMRIRTGDIIVIGQKAVSKSEGRIVNVENVRASKKAQKIARKTGKHPGFVHAVLGDTRRVLRADKTSFVVTTIQGATCLNGGADKSNIKGENVYVLLPRNPDASARKLRNGIKRITGQSVGIIISDSRSRPFRRGQVEEAIGLAGIDPLVDYRGKKDLFGYSLRFKNVNAADELASAAELVMGQGTEKAPVAIIRGARRLEFRTIANPGRRLTVGRREDLFRGTL